MYPTMRRSKQQMPIDEAKAILKQGKTGILAITYQDEPTMVPLNFVYAEDAIWFHCAKQGHKLEVIKNNPKVSFCVIVEDEVVPEKYSTKYQSVLAYGNAALIENEEEKFHALSMLIAKYCPMQVPYGKAYIEEGIANTAIVKIEIDHISGKFHK